MNKWGKNIELTIGQYGLNRLGILSLVAGFALFIAYSFQFIGAWGKLGIGFAAAAALLGLGKNIEKRPGLQWYGFGLIAGGWSLAYFATYAMHHIASTRVIADPNLALLALAAVTSVLMGDLMRYRSQTITTLIYVLAFFTAGVAKVTEFSLVYAALLTISLLFVVYRMKWNRLMPVALVSAYATHLVWLGPEILVSGAMGLPVSLEMSRFILSAGFLSLYGILFGIAPLIVSNESREDREIQGVVSVANTFCYSMLMFQEISRVNGEWRFWAALIFGALCAAAALAAKHGVKRDHLVTAYMTMAISFITASFPLKFIDRWVDAAWLAEIPALLYLGLRFKRFAYRAFAWGLTLIMGLKLCGLYAYWQSLSLGAFQGQAITERLLLSGIGAAAFLVAQAIYLRFKDSDALKDGEICVGRMYFTAGAFFFLMASVYDIHSNFLSIAWGIAAFAGFALGFGLRDRWFRYFALGLVALIVGRVAIFDIRDLPTIYRIVLFLGLGAALLLASFVYGKIAIAQKEKEAVS